MYTWGKGDYFRLGHGSDQHIRKPTIVETLRDKKIVQIAVGALHCLAVTESGQVPMRNSERMSFSENEKYFGTLTIAK